MEAELLHATPLRLDERQRSMLAAMGIELCWLKAQPQHGSPDALAAAPEAHKLKPNQPLAGNISAQSAIQSIAPSSPTWNTTPVVAAPSVRHMARAPRAEGIDRMDWLSLQQTVERCQACGLCESRKRVVFGVGPQPPAEGQIPQADWLIVGEAPGEQEDIRGEPFVGQAGKLLDNMLAAMRFAPFPEGLSRQRSVYIANVLKCRPPANRNPLPEEVAMCEPFLARQIALLKPKLILAMGKFAIQSTTGCTDPVGKLRGRVHRLRLGDPSIPVIVTYHPAYLLRNLSDKAKAWEDLLLAMRTYAELMRSQSEPGASG